MLWRSLCLASLAALVGCSYGYDVSPAPAAAAAAPTVTVVIPPSAPPVNAVAAAAARAAARSCASNDDCTANRAGGLCLPKPLSREVADGEDFLERAMKLHDLDIRLGDSSSAAPLPRILKQVKEDLRTYYEVAWGSIPLPGGVAVAAPGVAPTDAQDKQMRDGAWLQSGASQAEVLIQQLLANLSAETMTTDAQKVYADMAADGGGAHLDTVVVDVDAFVHDLEKVVRPIDELVDLRAADGGPLGLDTAAGALARYLEDVLAWIHGDVNGVKALLEPAAASRVKNGLAELSRGYGGGRRDGGAGRCLGPP